MRPVTCIALVPDPYGIGEVVVRAYECLHLAGIAPIGYATVDEPLIIVVRKNSTTITQHGVGGGVKSAPYVVDAEAFRSTSLAVDVALEIGVVL